MKTIGDPAVRAALTSRLERLDATQFAPWGTISVHQMVVHLGDGAEAALARRPFSAPSRRASRVLKWIALRLPLPWPHGIRAGADPATRAVSANAFTADRDRAVQTLRRTGRRAGKRVGSPPSIFGAMSRADWQRWAFLHTDHDLRQFGL